MAKEEFIKFGYVVTRLKTKRKIRIDFEGDEPEQIISRLRLDDGEILQDEQGMKLKVHHPQDISIWDQRIYNVEIIK